jgi:hypothetical protein
MESRTSHCSGLNPVFQLRLARRARAVCAAVDLSVGFNAVPDNSAIAVRANRCQRMDRALEAVEGVTFSTNDYLKRLVIFIFANFACKPYTNLTIEQKRANLLPTRGIDLISDALPFWQADDRPRQNCVRRRPARFTAHGAV